MKKLLCIVVIYLLAGHVFADPNMCVMQPGGILDTFQNDFFNQAQTFATKALPTITKVYWLLFCLWAGWELAFDKVLGMNIQRLYAWWVTRIFVAYTIEHIFLDPTFYIGILKFGAELGSKMGGFAVNPDSGSPLGAFTPSAIMGINDCVATAIQKAGISPLNIITSLELLLVQVGFLVITAIAAFYVMYLSIKIWIAMFAGFVNAMFAGNAWTVSWWQSYLSTVIKYSMELMIVAAMFGIINNQLMVFINQLSGADFKVVENFGTYTRTLAEVGFMVYLLVKLPSEISSAMGGSFGGKLTDIAGKIAFKASAFAVGGIGSGGGGQSGNTNRGGGMPPTGGGRANEVFGTRNEGSTSNPSDWKAEGGRTTVSTSSEVSSAQWKDAANKIGNV